MTRDQQLRTLLSDVSLYPGQLVGVALRPYQLAPARAIVASVLHHQALTFTVMMSRQAGKNELSAHVEAYLLTLYQRRGGSIVKAAPTFRPQIVNSMLRLQSILSSCPLTSRSWATSQGYIIALGRARAYYFSGGIDSQIVGATASLLLEIDEAQDFDEDKYLKDLRPMLASTNATTVLYGTAWTSDTLLEHVRQQNALLEAQDGVQRNFTYPWTEVAKANEAYGKFVAQEIARMGPEHPLSRTQYLLEPLSAAGRLFSESQLARLHGSHPSLSVPEPSELYVAGLDLAGGDEEDPSEILRPISRRDSTAVTIARVTWEEALGVLQPQVDVVHHQSWANVRHRDTFGQLVALLRLWHSQAIVVDASGIGAGVASFLVGALGADLVHPFTFTAVSKSDLGYQLLTTVNSGRLRIYVEDGSPESTELWSQLRLARSALHQNQRLSFQVDPHDGHDDLLISLALVVEAAQHSRPRVATGRPRRP